MRKEQTNCPTCTAVFACTVVELSRGQGSLRCPVCRELEIVQGRLGMMRGWPMGEDEFWREVAKRLAAYASREGVDVDLRVGSTRARVDEAPDV